MAEQYRVDGVISQVQRHDDEYAHEGLYLNKEKDDHRIPVLELEVEYGDGRSTQLTTRIEAFLDGLRNRTKQPVPWMGMPTESPAVIASESMSRKLH